MEEKYRIGFTKVLGWVIDNPDNTISKATLSFIHMAMEQPYMSETCWNAIRSMGRRIPSFPTRRGGRNPLPEAIDHTKFTIKGTWPIEEEDPYTINVISRGEGGYWLVEEEDMILFEDELREMEED